MYAPGSHDSVRSPRDYEGQDVDDWHLQRFHHLLKWTIKQLDDKVDDIEDDKTDDKVDDKAECKVDDRADDNW